jgi:hypothetical protein
MLGVLGTLLAVAAGSHLDLIVVGQPGVLVIPFTGAEVGIAAFVLRINTYRRANFFSGGGFIAGQSGGQLTLSAFLLGAMGGIQVDAGTSADVLVSLGLAVGQVSAPSTGVGLVSESFRISALRFFGGVQAGGGRANQHAIPAIVGGHPRVLVVDRQTATLGPGAEFSDSMRVAPLPQGGE